MAAKKREKHYYSRKEIKKKNAVYNVIYGVRSAGKTYDMLYGAVQDYWEARQKGELRQLAYLRRTDEALKAAMAGKVCNCLLCNGRKENVIDKITGGEFNNVTYYSGAWTLSRTDPETGLTKKDKNPFMLGFALSTWDKMKGGSYPFVSDIWFEEFIEVSTKPYIKNEFAAFQNVISTIARDRHVKIWMTGNSINPYCPYFEWMGLHNVAQQKAGTIDIYKIGKTDKKIAVEFTSADTEFTDSVAGNGYLFAFEDPQLKMITTGDWEIRSYPIIESDVKERDICGRIYIKFKGKIFEGDIISTPQEQFLYIHKYDDPFYPPDEMHDLIYSLEYSVKPNYRRRFDRVTTRAEEVVNSLFLIDKVFYDTNSTGNAIENYIKLSTQG